MQWTPIDQLKPNPKNPNKHSKEQIERLAKLIKYQGWRLPIIVSKLSGYIVAGHGRLEAAKHLRLKEVPVAFQDFTDADQEYAFLVSDNSIASWAELDLAGINTDIGDLGPDFDIDLLGIEDFVIEPTEKLEPGCNEDEVPEHVEPITKARDLYLLGKHRLLCGDSTSIDAVEKLMNGEKADIVFTDPPYGVNVVANNGTVASGKLCKPGVYSKIIGDDTTDTARDCYNLITALEIPVICLWGGNYYSEFCPASPGWIVWDKRGDMASNDFPDCELAWTNQKRPARIYKQLWSGMIKEGEKGKRVHPTQKPIALAEWCFEKLDKDSKSVLDLFGGSGSTLIACEKTNRKCFMMELDPHYCDVIVARWEKYTGKKAELINGQTA